MVFLFKETISARYLISLGTLCEGITVLSYTFIFAHIPNKKISIKLWTKSNQDSQEFPDNKII